MEFKKIAIGKGRTLNCTYLNDYSDVVTLAGSNVVHRDLREAMEALVLHFALLTESREAGASTLKELEEDKDLRERVNKKLSVTGITMSDEGRAVSIEGTRILANGSIMKLVTPAVLIDDTESYIYCGELCLAVEQVEYEAELYLREGKWDIKEGELFGEDVPFNNVKAEKAEGVKVTVGDTSVVVPTKGRKKNKKEVEKCA